MHNYDVWRLIILLYSIGLGWKLVTDPGDIGNRLTGMYGAGFGKFGGEARRSLRRMPQSSRAASHRLKGRRKARAVSNPSSCSRTQLRVATV